MTICELEDVDGEFMWLNSKRSESEWQAGVGQSKIISTTKKYKKLINKICIYAVTYYKDSFHTKTKCKNWYRWKIFILKSISATLVGYSQ